MISSTGAEFSTVLKSCAVLSMCREISVFKIDVTAGVRLRQDPGYRNSKQLLFRASTALFVCEICWLARKYLTTTLKKIN